MKYSIRLFLQNPGFTITAVAALALGIGATIAIFSIVNTVLLKPLPVSDPNRLVMLVTTGVSDTGESESDIDASPAKFAHWRAQSSVLQEVSALLAGVVNYTGGDAVEQWRSMQVSVDFFRCWGLKMVRGRTFTREEDSPNGPSAIVISEGLWARRFASDPQILGKTISLDGEPHVVIGILPETVALREFGPPPEVFVPFQLDPDSRGQGNYFKVAARLKPGVTLAQAKERLQASVAEFRTKFPETSGEKGGFTVTPLREALVGDIRPLLLILLSAVGLVLLIACANVANLLLVRAAGGERLRSGRQSAPPGGRSCTNC